jgi:Ca-activated chloride channel homolog
MLRKRLPHFLFGLVMLLVSIFPSTGAALGTFNVRVEYVDNDQFPLVEAYVSVSDLNGLPIKEELADSAFILTEDGSSIAAPEIERFTNMEQSLAIALIVDTSLSMDSKAKPTPMNKAVDAARYFVQELADQDQVAVIKFSEEPEVVLDLTAAHDNKVMLALDSLKPEKNKTALYDAIVEGSKLLKSFNGRRIIVVVTDGKDTGSGLFDFDTAAREATTNLISVYPMGFGGVINVQKMKQMAELTGGVAQIQPSALELQASFTTILDILREQYRIRYVSNLPADNKDHELVVAVNYQGGREQASHHFLSRSSSIPLNMPSYQPDQVVGGLVKFAPIIDWQVPLKNLEILIDGTQVASIGSAPYEYEWNSFESDVLPGPHDFVIKATDIAGNVGQSSVSLNVQPPITVEILSPADYSKVSGIVKINARVIPLSHISLGRVAFVINGKEVASVPAAPGVLEYKAEWDARDYPAGTYSLSVIAYDAKTLFPTEQKLHVNVEVGNYSWMIILGVLAVSLLIIPIAARSRRKTGVRAPAATAIPTPVPGGQPVLRELEGLSPNQAWSLGVSETKLGRKRDENDIPLKGLKASRHHASIRFEQGLYVIYGLSPNNPVLVNNQPIQQKQVLRTGDTIQLGETILRFEM